MFFSANFSSWYFFFFQAEDGIRDDLVTGVQTCALPIYAAPAPGRQRRDDLAELRRRAREGRVEVRVVRRPHEPLVAQELDHGGERLLVGVEAHPHLVVELLERAARDARAQAREEPHVMVEPLEPALHPAAARFEHDHLEVA